MTAKVRSISNRDRQGLFKPSHSRNLFLFVCLPTASRNASFPWLTVDLPRRHGVRFEVPANLKQRVANASDQKANRCMIDYLTEVLVYLLHRTSRLFPRASTGSISIVRDLKYHRGSFRAF